MVNGDPADDTKAQNFASNLRALSASNFIDPPESESLNSYGLAKPAKTLGVILASGQELMFFFGTPDESERTPVKREGQDVLFWLPKWRMEEIPKAASELVSAPEPAS